ncbi:hypothetical protein GCM10023200_19740 [Actinomycetospora chlora]|uniref:Transcriptional regulator n=1 Tax=Actinomycetospora chlora TaxID=663608 RepID=A0ABP9ATP9_9PSEU
MEVRVLGEMTVTREGARLPLGDELRDTLALIALSGPAGISPGRLVEELPGTYRVTRTNVYQRVLSLRQRVPIVGGGPKREPYALDRARVYVDADAFIGGVRRLVDRPDPAALDRLMGLWRGDPWDRSAIARAGPWAEVRRARERLVELVLALDDGDRAALTRLNSFVALFPEDQTLERVRRACRERPRLLVIEDEIMADLRSILDSEFRVQPVVDIEGWNVVRESLDVEGVLIDRHLTANLTDDRGTTVIADFLRRHTEIPATLMTVAPPPTASGHVDLQAKYRLLEVVHKTGLGGALNETHLLDAARALVDRREQAHRRRLELWVRSDLFHVEDDQRFNPSSTDAARRLAKCRHAAEALRPVLIDGPIEVAVQQVSRFHREWGPRRPEATF